jgi:hypothetical protein
VLYLAITAEYTFAVEPELTAQDLEIVTKIVRLDRPPSRTAVGEDGEIYEAMKKSPRRGAVLRRCLLEAEGDRKKEILIRFMAALGMETYEAAGAQRIVLTEEEAIGELVALMDSHDPDIRMYAARELSLAPDDAVRSRGLEIVVALKRHGTGGTALLGKTGCA